MRLLLPTIVPRTTGFVKGLDLVYNALVNKKYYVTTPIYYVNDVPHIGHTCTTVVADVLAQYHKLLGDEVFFLTGTDEHGAKVAEAAAKAGQTPQEFCDEIVAIFQNIWPRLNIQSDAFIRTTDPRHATIVSKVITKIYKQGDIYKGTYEGLYCVGCEKFLMPDDLVDGLCPLHNRAPEHQKEENYFFKLSKYVPALIKAIEDPNDPNHYQIEPASKRNEVLSKLKAEVKDLSISRANVTWGIPIPWDSSQTIYVWFEALLNYYTATRIFGREEFWEQAHHIIGKEIMWFHCVIWEAMLMSAGLKMPREVFVHSFFNIDGQKMSKSLGNVISPEMLLQKFGVDGTRYLILASFPHNDDSDVGLGKFTQKYNSDLANNLGNLFSRFTKLSEQVALGNDEPVPGFKDVINQPAWQTLKTAYEALDFARVVEEINLALNNVNRALQKAKPWEKEDISDRQTILKTILPNILDIAILISPLMPTTSDEISKGLTGKIIAQPPLFPRIKP